MISDEMLGMVIKELNKLVIDNLPCLPQQNDDTRWSRI
jgi:hypothetical protein